MFPQRIAGGEKKKLIEAARRLYGGGNDPESLAAFGLPTAAAKSFEDAPCEVWVNNWPTVQLFAALGTQWRVGMSGATGLDYAAIAPAARALRIKLKPSRFDGLRVMEAAALKVMEAKRERK